MLEAGLPEQLRRFLLPASLASLATIGADGAPQATVVWFDLDGDRILVNTKPGRAKERNLRADPRVALTVFDPAEPYRSVQLRGRVGETRRGPAAVADIHRLSRRYTGHDYAEEGERISYLIDIASWSSWGL